MSKTLLISEGSHDGTAAPGRSRSLMIGMPSLVLGLTFVVAAVAGLPRFATAEPGGVLDGAWTGGGSVSYPSGAKEKARCKATFKRESGASYVVSAVCASPSGKVAQTATVQRQGGDVYAGSFYNKEYGVDGSIYIKLQGNSQNVTLIGGGGTANFRLSR